MQYITDEFPRMLAGSILGGQVYVIRDVLKGSAWFKVNKMAF